MDEVLARLALLVDGAFGAAASRIAGVRWRFAPGGVALLLVGAIAAVGLALLCYCRTTEGLTRRSRVLLGLLRFTAVALLLVMAAGTVCSIDFFAPERPQLLVILDDSPSMDLPAGGETRLAAAERALEESLLERLRQEYSVRLVRTSGGEPAGPQDLARSVVLQGSQPGPRPIEHILLISDGVQLGPASLSRAAAELPAPISCLAVGGDSVRDAILAGVTVPPYVYARDRALVTAEVRSIGLTGEAVVQLSQVTGSAERQMSTTTVALAPGDAPVVACLEFLAPAAGVRRYVLRLLPVEGELTDRNNAVAFNLDVRDEKVRVLFVEGEPSWEYRYAKQALESDPAVEFYGLVRLPEREWFYQGRPRRPDGKPVLRDVRKGFPGTPDELSFFDVLVLGDLERKFFEQDGRFALVESFVRARGGGLATLGGYKTYAAGDYEGTLLAAMLPVAVRREKKLHMINRFHVRVTNQGLMHPVMQLEFDPVRNVRAWASLPWVEGGNTLQGVKPGATRLLVHPKLRLANAPRPVAACWQYGRGRVYSTALDGTWHWRLARKSETDYHARSWGLLVRWLAGDPRLKEAQGSLMAEDAVLEVGKPAALSLMLRDRRGNPTLDADVVFTVEPPSGEELTVRGISDPAAPGRYALNFVPRIAGEHTVRASVTPRAGKTETQERTYYVGLSRAEFLTVRPDAAALAELATGGGGTAAALADHRSLELPKLPERATSRAAVVDLWQAPGVVVLLAACLCAEWLMRKRRGLA